MLTLAYLTHRLVPAMIKRGRGGVLNVSSGYGLVFGPSMAGYIGTKHFVTGFTEGLRLDLTGTGVGVTQVLPGPTRTEFSQAMAKVSATTQRVHIPEFIRCTAEHCARVAIQGLRNGRARVIPGFWMNVLLRTSKFLPLWLVRWVMSGRAENFRESQASAPIV
jgi:short-subunit dehydrogenase